MQVTGFLRQSHGRGLSIIRLTELTQELSTERSPSIKSNVLKLGKGDKASKKG